MNHDKNPMRREAFESGIAFHNRGARGSDARLIAPFLGRFLRGRTLS